jgi:nucleoside-diphosphate-sugar epimerase
MKLEGTIGITGIGGFIGGQMTMRALSLGMKVKGMDASEVAIKSLVKKVSEHPQGHNFHGAFPGDVTDPKAAARLCQDCEIIFHTAAIVTEDSTFERSRHVNVHGTIVMAQAAAQHHVKRFVHLSSVMVYGFTFPKYVKEDGPKRGENDPYCQTKIESEEAVMKFHRPGNGGMEVIIIRPGDVYGPRSPQWVLGALVLLQREQLVLPDGGRGCMNHVHVDNLIDGVFLAIQNDKATGEAFNITDGGNTSGWSIILELRRLARPLLLAPCHFT